MSAPTRLGAATSRNSCWGVKSKPVASSSAAETLQISQTEKPRCSAKIDQTRLRRATRLPPPSQKAASSGRQSSIQRRVRRAGAPDPGSRRVVGESWRVATGRAPSQVMRVEGRDHRAGHQSGARRFPARTVRRLLEVNFSSRPHRPHGLTPQATRHKDTCNAGLWTPPKACAPGDPSITPRYMREERRVVLREGRGSGSAQGVRRQRDADVVGDERHDREGVEHLVEAEPRRERVGLAEAVDDAAEGVEQAADRDERRSPRCWPRRRSRRRRRPRPSPARGRSGRRASAGRSRQSTRKRDAEAGPAPDDARAAPCGSAPSSSSSVKGV